MKVNIKAVFNEKYEVSGQGTLEDNYKEALSMLQEDLHNGDVSLRDDAHVECEPVIGAADIFRDMAVSWSQDGKSIEIYLNGYYMSTVEFDNLSDEVKKDLGIIKPDTDDVPDMYVEPEDYTIHVYNDHSSRVWIECQVSEVFPDDPGNGSPVSVIMTNNGEEYNASLAMYEGEGVLIDDNGLEVTPQYEIRKAIAEHAPKAWDWLDATTKYIEKNGQP